MYHILNELKYLCGTNFPNTDMFKSQFDFCSSRACKVKDNHTEILANKQEFPSIDSDCLVVNVPGNKSMFVNFMFT